VPSFEGLAAGGDEDADGLSNSYEIEHRLDPRSSDTDKDGLSDAGELAVGTDPTRVDSDLDGVTDHAEIQYGTNPVDATPPSSAWSVQDVTDGDAGLG
jgi:hypothetical protein